MRDIFKNSSPFLQISLILFLVFVGLSVFLVLGVFLSALIFQIDIYTVTSSFNDLENSNVVMLKFLQSMYSVGLFIFPAIVGAWLLSDKVCLYLHINKFPKLSLLVLAVIIVLVISPVVNAIVEWNESISMPASMKAIEEWMKEMENNAKNATELFLKANSFSVYISNVIVLALIPAVGEELLFRGILQKLFYNWFNKIHFAIWLSAFLFSALHMQFYGFFPRMLLGALFGYLFFWSGNLWIPITTHFINNLLAVTLFYINNSYTKEIENIGTADNAFLYIILSIILFSILLFYFYKMNLKKRT